TYLSGENASLEHRRLRRRARIIKVPFLFRSPKEGCRATAPAQFVSVAKRCSRHRKMRASLLPARTINPSNALATTAVPPAARRQELWRAPGGPAPFLLIRALAPHPAISVNHGASRIFGPRLAFRGHDVGPGPATPPNFWLGML